MLIKTILNRIEKFKSFVFGKAWIEGTQGKETLVVEIQPRKNSRPECPVCGRRRAVHDTQDIREFDDLLLWVFRVVFRYAPRRVNCPGDGVLIEWMPWDKGKERMTSRYKVFLARWARRISWKETAQLFETSWGCVFRAVQFVVEHGLAHRSLEGVTQIGVDEIAVFKGHHYLTMDYPAGCRLSASSLVRGRAEGRDSAPILSDVRERTCVHASIRVQRHVEAYLDVIKQHAPQALNILDRFHIIKSSVRPSIRSGARK